MKDKIIIGLIISIIAVGLYYWNYNNSEPEIENEIIENEEVEDSSVVEEDSEITKSNNNANKSIIEENVMHEKSEDIIIDSEKSNDEKEEKTNNRDKKVLKSTNDRQSKPKKEELNEEAKKQDENKQVKDKTYPKEIEASIVAKYTILFQGLKSEYEVKLNNMISKAKEEYLSLSEEERDKQKFNLAVKYLKLGMALESECDKKFYLLLNQMKSELKANDLKNDFANAAEKQYKEEKSSRQKQLLAKAL